jgi:hypothetical protein
LRQRRKTTSSSIPTKFTRSCFVAAARVVGSASFKNRQTRKSQSSEQADHVATPLDEAVRSMDRRHVRRLAAEAGGQDTQPARSATGAKKGRGVAQNEEIFRQVSGTKIMTVTLNRGDRISSGSAQLSLA